MVDGSMKQPVMMETRVVEMDVTQDAVLSQTITAEGDSSVIKTSAIGQLLQ